MARRAARNTSFKYYWDAWEIVEMPRLSSNEMSNFGFAPPIPMRTIEVRAEDVPKPDLIDVLARVLLARAVILSLAEEDEDEGDEIDFIERDLD